MDPSGEFDFADALRRLVDVGGSDLHIKAGNRPLMRVHGKLEWVDETCRPLTSADTEKLLHEVLPGSRIKEFEYAHEVDAAYSVPGLARFRLNAYQQRGSVSMVMRVIPHAIQSVSELGLPSVVGRLAQEERGIVLVSGSTGCGKSTTLAAMIAQINATSRKHIVTIEDPIEYLHRDDRSSIDQREVGSDTDSFATALRRILRQDPDVILIGEIRDEETVRTALSAAETGHLVLSTLHTIDAAETVNRILDFFPPNEKQPIRAMLAGTLKGIVSQRLVPAASGEGRVPICEVFTMTGRGHDMILDPEQTSHLTDVIADGEYYGMQTFDQALYQALSRGDVSMDDALHYASRPHDLKLLVAAEGQISTSMDDVYVNSARAPASAE
ncbi:MAG: type IV pilus twitching motility protein PilT [Candidatus Limnocylindria bacterium]